MSKMSELSAVIAVVALRGKEVQDVCHDLAVKAGWWTDLGTGGLFTAQRVNEMVPQKLLLIHSEVSEACEAHRKNLADDKLPHRDGLEVELADVVIRVFDLAGKLGYDLGAAMAEKLAYNAMRVDHTLEHRRGSGGKSY